MATGLVVSSEMRLAVTAVISTPLSKSDAAPCTAALHETDNRGSQPRNEAIEGGRVVDDVGAVKRRAKHRGVCDLSAIAAANTTIVDHRDRIVLERVVR